MSEDAGSVLSALKAGPWREPAHAWLYNVRNRTGYSHGGRNRYADALVVSCFPSRGIWLAGVEVKVDRRDWVRELDDPTKSAPIQRYCNYWWVAAPQGVIHANEIPETWGLLGVDDKNVSILKPAPKLEPEPWTPEFLASVLRAEAKAQEVHRQRGYHEGWEAAQEKLGADAIDQLREEKRAAEHAKRESESKLQWAERHLAALRESVRLFEQEIGIPERTIESNGAHGIRGVATTFRAAQLIASADAERTAGLLESAVTALRELPKVNP